MPPSFTFSATSPITVLDPYTGSEARKVCRYAIMKNFTFRDPFGFDKLSLRLPPLLSGPYPELVEGYGLEELPQGHMVVIHHLQHFNAPHQIYERSFPTPCYNIQDKITNTFFSELCRLKADRPRQAVDRVWQETAMPPGILERRSSKASSGLWYQRTSSSGQVLLFF